MIDGISLVGFWTDPNVKCAITLQLKAIRKNHNVVIGKNSNKIG